MGSNSTNSTRAKCTDLQMPFQYSLYEATYILIFIPGLLANTVTLWVLRRFINKKNKAIIFIINLSVAELAHVLSLPFWIYYYIISQHICQHLLPDMHQPSEVLLSLKSFRAGDWKRRYDVGISATIWVIMGTACLPFPILRSTGLGNNTEYCFGALGLQHINMTSSLGMVTVAELGGFLLPIIIITYFTWKTRKSLREFQVPPRNTKERKKALRMVLMCEMVFLVCFTPYHLNFPFFMMVKEHVFLNCSFIKSTLCFHIISLSLANLANLNCCLDLVVYYFMTSKFRDRFSDHGNLVLQSCMRCSSLSSALS
uniref:G-protein coupled receptors family 1 profile domain-containing protein n=1 Tax=Piliocolobus tephrosceles TaxID=591936 RepID=A0A8C9GX97_9PRIM